MRRLWWLLLLSACGERVVVPTGSAELALPEAVRFSPTAVSFSRRERVVLTNRARASMTVTLATSPPFAIETTELLVPGGADVELSITFSPVVAGAVEGALLVDEVAIPLEGAGVAVPGCAAAGVCETVRFDPDTLACVREPKADGTACEDLLQCIEGGSCRAGACLGRAARCDDDNACSADACAVGLGCQHAPVECAAPTNPCLAPRCDPRLGCTTSPVQDGTACGAVSCELANVCLAGVCRAVVPPEGFTCAPASACRGEGQCRNRTCVTPAERELAPRWTYTSNDGDFRFEGVTDAQGNWYWVECGAGATPNGHRCSAVSRTADGLERFRTAVFGPGVLRGTTRHTQLLAGGRYVFVTNEGTLAAIDASTGALLWQRSLTALPSTTYRGIQELAEDGRGQLWVVLRSEQNRQWRDALVLLDTATGAVRSETTWAQLRGLVLDDLGRAYTLRDERLAPTNPTLPYWLTRLEADGGVGLTVQLPTGQLPVMVVGDRLVLQDDSVRSTATLAELEGPFPPEWSGWQWPGVAASPTSRARMTETTLDLAPSLSLQVTTNGRRSTALVVNAQRGSDLHLTASGDVLFITGNEVGRSGATTETRARLVHPRGVELMSCPLVDEVIWAGGSEQLGPLQLGPDTGFNGRWLAVSALPVDCPVCDHADVWAPPRLAFYDLGTPAPGLPSTGWVAPRGTPAGSQRPR
ncbi:MAG: PQQ-binding-like beta-propeller repeat protein [Myxococcaceae bacterium]|nr:PQQ-binding-like beta-propeller repeat protein [Myxococcaceae bacterium]